MLLSRAQPGDMCMHGSAKAEGPSCQMRGPLWAWMGAPEDLSLRQWLWPF